MLSTQSPSCPHIPGYSILEPIYVGTQTAVYRSLEIESQRTVVIKTLQNPLPSFRELVQFRNQYVLTKNLDISGIIQPLAFVPFGKAYALVMEDWGGIDLGRYAQHVQFSIDQVLAIAIQLADILHNLQQHCIIHKDIKPANILIRPDSQQIKLIDFSIATLLPKEVLEIQKPNQLDGSLPYLAPEQTGRMNRGIDYRVDFYALGVTLYELLTGKLPFQSQDPLELIHCHIAQEPKPLQSINPQVPKMVAAIVAKLMAKNAEDRYQTPLGLKRDLEQCLASWLRSKDVETFPLGARDIGDRFLIPEKLYGRETEVATLLAAFDRITQPDNPSRGEMIWVTGYSGIGKTSVVKEVQRSVIQKQGYFIQGKCDQFNQNIPFAVFVQAFRDLMTQLLSESDIKLAQWKRRILASIHENGQVLIDVIPELKLIIGKQPPVADLFGSAAQNRFNNIFLSFIQVFTQPEHPLIIFLDDLQWIDPASLNLLNLLTTDLRAQHLLLIGAYRDNEVFAAHPLMLTLDSLRQENHPIQTLTLPPLSPENLNTLIANILHCSRTKAWPLTDLTYQKTLGNPFFATQFLKQIYQDQLITFDAQQGTWQCAIDQVKTAAVTEDVVEFMAHQLQKLPMETQNVLQIAACIGNQFDVETVAIAQSRSVNQVTTALWPALKDGLILSQGHLYRFDSEDTLPDWDLEVTRPVMHYKFLHDRVQQAAYALIPNTDKTQTHFKIGQLLWQQFKQTPQQVNLFEIVNQLNLGRSLIREETMRSELAKLNFKVGQQAKQSTAYGAAIDYFKTALELLTPQVWKQDYSLTIQLYSDAVEASYLNGDFLAMGQFYTSLQRNAKTPLDMLRASEIKIEALVAQGRLQKSLEYGCQLLSQFGVILPLTATEQEQKLVLNQAQNIIGNRTPADLLDLPLAVDPKAIAAMRILVMLAAPAYLVAPTLYPLIPALGITLTVEKGLATASSHLFTCYGLLNCAIFQDYALGKAYGQLALDSCHRLNDQEFQARAWLMNGLFISHWTGHLKESLMQLQQGYRIGLATGDSAYASYAAFTYCFHSYLLGEPLPELLPKIEKYQQVIERLHQGTILNYHDIYHQVILNFLGQSDTPWVIQGQVYDETVMRPLHEEVNDHVALAHLYINQLTLNVWFGRWDEAIACGNLAKPYLGGAAALATLPYYHCYDALARLAQAQSLPPTAQIDAAPIQAHLQTLQVWAQHGPMNIQHKLDLLWAEYYRWQNKKAQAMEAFDRAIAGAQAHGYMQEQAIANERAALFYLDWGKVRIAADYMQEAYYAVSHWGAKAKIIDLETHYPHLLRDIFQPSVPKQPQTVSGLTGLTGLRNLTHVTQDKNQWLDYPVLLKAAQAISQEIELEKLLATLMHIAIAHAAAERVQLFLLRDQQWWLMAQATSELAEVLEIPLTECQQVPLSLIYKSIHQPDNFVFSNLSLDERFASDPYVQHQQPKSVLCLPVRHQGQLIGILYLENNLVPGAFTPDRIEILHLLTSQAAIALENARLYAERAQYSQQLEQEVEQQTAALQDKAQDLEQTLTTLQLTNEELIRVTRLKDEFLANMSHELRTPLNAILGMVEGLQDEVFGTISASQLKALKTVEQSAAHLLELINDILDVAKIESGQMTLDLQLTTVEDLCASSLTFIHQQATAKDIKIEHQFAPSLPALEIDLRRMRQVLINLLNNAVKFTPSQGCITLKTSLRKPETGSSLQNSVQIEVSDTGIGIEPEHIGSLFQPFMQIDSAINREYQGTGLGLVLVKRMVELHGGQVDVTSEVGIGSCFKINLPCPPVVRHPIPEDSPASEIEAPSVQDQTLNTTVAPLILLAEDNEANIETFSSYLEAYGYRVQIAHNGFQALDRLREFEPDLIVMDIQMPKMDGLEAIRQIRQEAQYQHLPIIALTALVMPGDKERCLRAGATEYISKPVRLKELASQIQRLLNST